MIIESTNIIEGVNAKFFSRHVKEHHIKEDINLIISNITKKNGVWLDIGCGMGNLLKEIQKSTINNSLLGLEPSKQMIKLARGKTKKRIVFIRGVGEALPFKNDTIDLIILSFVLHHIKKKDALFKEINRVARKKCELIILDRISAYHLFKFLFPFLWKFVYEKSYQWREEVPHVPSQRDVCFLLLSNKFLIRKIMTISYSFKRNLKDSMFPRTLIISEKVDKK
jgi:ubiquinone/menaquinone biosynthesis C-methylase UbiE